MTLFWKKLSHERKFNLSTFRNTKKHNIFANWSPYSRGLTYHNFLINFYVNLNKKKFIKFKKSINNLNLGNSPGILYDNKYHITYDDCISFEECTFLKKNFKIKKNINIIEIGPGYGRSVENILKNFNVSKYVLVDYKNILVLTKKYLKKVLDVKLFNKLIFCDFETFNFKKNFFYENYAISNFDLFFNSDSFHEMETKIVKKYLNYFSTKCKNFFIKNAIAKYKASDLVNHLSKNNVPNYNKKLGLCNNIINIFDKKKVKIQSKDYIKKYNPFKNNVKFDYCISSIYPSCMLAIFSKKKLKL